MKRNKQTRKTRIRKLRAFGAALVISMLAACGLSQFDGNRPDDPQTLNSSAQASRYEAVRHNLLISQPLASMPGTTSSETIARYGMPNRQSTERIENPHVAGQTDEWIELEYPGMRVSYYRNTATGQEFLGYLRISSDAHPLKQELAIGDSFERFQLALGNLTEAGEDQFEACDTLGRGDCLRLRVADQKVVSIEQVKMVD